ncbi:MAG TPA: hypothetical protein VGD01_01565 [Candidatus Elarobacter sp.]|jgi:hypothetical protein
MTRRVLMIAAAALLGGAPYCASAADPVRPLRTLTYTVDVSITDSIEASSTIVANGNRPPANGGRAARQQRPAATTAGSGTRGTGVTIATQGTIVVEVVQATEDAGLIVDVSEDAPKRIRPKLRVGVSSDGALLYDPAATDKLSVEEAAVIRWLGRGFYGDHPTEVGTAWTVDQSSKGYTDVERYRVLSRDASRVTLNYALEESTTLAGGYAGSREGSLIYDTALVVPVKAAFEAVSHRQLTEGYNTMRTSVRLTLTADSFSKPASLTAGGR